MLHVVFDPFIDTIHSDYDVDKTPARYPGVVATLLLGGSKSLYFALMMSFGGEYKSSGAIPGVQVALDKINNDSTLLPGYKLHYTLTDSRVRAYFQ